MPTTPANPLALQPEAPRHERDSSARINADPTEQIPLSSPTGSASTVSIIKPRVIPERPSCLPFFHALATMRAACAESAGTLRTSGDTLLMVAEILTLSESDGCHVFR